MSNFTRRQFLQSAAAATLLTALPSSVLRGQEAPVAASAGGRKLGVAMIGIGTRGTPLFAETMGLANVSAVAVCDVDAGHLQRANAKAPGAKAFVDYREAIKHPGVDAVVIATPDHTHAVIAAAAMRAGKHVYCEKPLGHTIQETRDLTKLAEETKVCTQLGIQIHSLDNYRRVVELVQAGAIGPVREVHIWNNRHNHPADGQLADPPAALNYDLWLGPAQYRPYHTAFHPVNWRRFWTFGEGMMGDIGCHFLDLPFWALGIRHPSKVSATSPSQPTPDGEITPEALIVKYQFPAVELAPKGVPVTWYDPPHKPEAIAEWGVPANLTAEAIMFIGEKGMLCSSYTQHVLLPEAKYKDYKRPEPSIPSSPGHPAEWVNACLAGDPSKTSCPFSYGGPLSEAALLGPIAYRVGKELQWDAKALRFTNDERANEHLRYQYREGWSL